MTLSTENASDNKGIGISGCLINSFQVILRNKLCFLKFGFWDSKLNSFSVDSVIDDIPKYDLTYKVIIIGDSGVGKTNLLERWLRNQYIKASTTTISVDWSNKYFKVKDRVVQVTFCDTAGQERYKSLTRQYFRNAHGVVIVYDITERNTYRHINVWLDDVKNANSDFNPVILLVGNKNDLIEERAVTIEEALEKAKQEDLFFLETSALDGSNCNVAMQLILQYIHNAFEKTQINSETNSISIGQSVKIGLTTTNNNNPENSPPEDTPCVC